MEMHPTPRSPPIIGKRERANPCEQLGTFFRFYICDDARSRKYGHVERISRNGKGSHRTIFKRFQSFYSSALSSSSPLVVSIFNDSCSLSYTFTGYNYMYGHDHLRLYSDHDISTASLIRFIRHHFGFISHMESFVYELSTS